MKNPEIQVVTSIEIGGKHISLQDVCDLLEELAYRRLIDVALFINGCCVSVDIDHVVQNSTGIQIGTEKRNDLVHKDNIKELTP